MTKGATRPSVAWARTSRGARYLAIGSMPLSLVTAGATVSMALVALYGVIAIKRGARLDETMRRAFWFLAASYLALLAIDLVNGGFLVNFISTGFNYLHLIAVAPLALAFVILKVEDHTIARAMQIAIWLALANSLIRFFVFGEDRPGGPSLNPIPYGFVIAMWGAFLLSRGLHEKQDQRLCLAAAVIAVVPVLLTQSKIVWAAMIGGYAVVLLVSAIQLRQTAFLWKSALLALPILVGGYFLLAHRRIAELFDELRLYIEQGSLESISFGYRLELVLNSISAFGERPWLGHGLDERREAVFAHADPSGPDIFALGHLHNEYLTHMVSFGIVGLVFVLAFLVFVVWVAWQARYAYLAAAGTGLAAMLAIYMCAEVVFNMDPMSGSVTIALALLLMRNRSRSQADLGT